MGDILADIDTDRGKRRRGCCCGLHGLLLRELRIVLADYPAVRNGSAQSGTAGECIVRRRGCRDLVGFAEDRRLAVVRLVIANVHDDLAIRVEKGSYGA